MNKEIIKARFKYYREQVNILLTQIEDLEYQLSEQSYYHGETISRIERRAQACRNELLEKERQAETDRWYQEEQLRSATHELERAREYGDEWGEQRALRKLKNLY
jgi:hypothetical protein